MREGRMVANFPGSEATYHRILRKRLVLKLQYRVSHARTHWYVTHRTSIEKHLASDRRLARRSRLPWSHNSNQGGNHAIR